MPQFDHWATSRFEARPARAARQETTMISEQIASERHILAGDDSPEVLALLRDILESEGFRVSMRGDPLTLAEIRRTGPDLVILDHMLDDGAGSGWELLRDIRRDPDLSGLPVVVCTGAIQRVRAQGEELHQLGAQVVLKPFDIDQLLAAVHHFWPVGANRCAGGAGKCRLDVAGEVQAHQAE
jgi:DNA-binding response OmpR family regulator